MGDEQHRRLKSDSPTCRRVVRSFLDFLNSVEPAPGVDFEGLEVAKDCLTEVFRLRQLPESEQPEPNLLVRLFGSQEGCSNGEVKGSSVEEPSARPSAENHADGDSARTSGIQDNGRVRESDDSGMSKDELFGHYFDALERIHFFRTPNGEDDHALLDRATSFFHDAVNEIGISGCGVINKKSLANALKTLGNKAMQSKLYSDAIERYTCAIALCGDNAVYYCNRAAAYTQLHKYNEAVADSLKSIEIDPHYSKAYSRLGLAYYAQGKYSEAINKGFKKALELDPNNDGVKENIRVAEQKLIEQQRNQYQDSRYNFAGGSGNQAGMPSFPVNLASLFSNLTGNASQNQNGQSRSAESNQGTYTSFTANTSDGNAVPIDIANMSEEASSRIMNFARNTFQGVDSESRSGDQTQEGGASNPFSSMAFDTGTLPSDLAGMFRNMSGQESQGQSGQNPAQEGSNVGGSGDPGVNFSFNMSGQSGEDYSRTFRSVVELLSGGGDVEAQGNMDGRPESRM